MADHGQGGQQVREWRQYQQDDRDQGKECHGDDPQLEAVFAAHYKGEFLEQVVRACVGRLKRAHVALGAQACCCGECCSGACERPVASFPKHDLNQGRDEDEHGGQLHISGQQCTPCQ